MSYIDIDYYLSDEYVLREFAQVKSRQNPRQHFGLDENESQPKAILPRFDVAAPFDERDSLYHNLHALQQVVSPEERNLIDKFITHHGPESVYQFSKQKPNENNTYRTAVGRTFERLTFHWVTELPLKDNQGKDLHVLDPGSCSRVFNGIGANFIPDGAIVKPDNPPTIEHLLEYKMSPGLHVADILFQLNNMQTFQKRYGGKTIQMTRPVVIDRIKKIKSTQFHVSKNLQIFLISPLERPPSDQLGKGIHFIQTTFLPSFVKAVTLATLKDMADTRGYNGYSK